MYCISSLIAGDFQKFTPDLVIAFTLTSISSMSVTKCMSTLPYSPSNSLRPTLVALNLLLSHCWAPVMLFMNFIHWLYVHPGQCSYLFWALGGLLFGLAWNLHPFWVPLGQCSTYLTARKLLEMMTRYSILLLTPIVMVITVFNCLCPTIHNHLYC